MEQTVDGLLDLAVAGTTLKRYVSVWKRYTEWCGGLGEQPLPVTEELAMGYVVSLARDSMKAGTIKYHLAGLRMVQVRAGMAPPDWGAMARLSMLRKGLARAQATGDAEKLHREPVTWKHMAALKTVWDGDGERGVMLWAAACTCFFGCLRAGEALAPEAGHFDDKAHLSWEDVQMEQVPSPRWIRVRIKESKTDRLRKGAYVRLPRTDADICPVVAVLRYMAARKAGPGPFFRTEGGRGLTRRVFVSEVKAALVKHGIPHQGISGHSFRIGAATEAARSGASDEEVKALGRWRSREYRGYIRREEGDQAAAANRLTRSGAQVKPDQDLSRT